MTALKHMRADGSTPQTSPLDRLAERLAPGMAATNALILDRMRSHIPLVSQLAAYLIAAGGKRIRPLLTLAAASEDGKPQTPGAAGLAAAVEFIHTATLLHDDVVDESARRRGQASANMMFGNKASVLVGDFLFARAFELMVESDDLRILEILARAARVIAEGEVLQMSLTGDMGMTLDHYAAIIEAKTAALFGAATQAGALSAKADAARAEDWRSYGHHLGMAFQMADDLIDYAQTAENMGKDAGDDFREGKLTLPVILALRQADDREKAFWTRCMKDRAQEDGDLDRARGILDARGSLDEGRALAATHAKAARAALERLGPGKTVTLLDELLDFVLTRDH